MNCLAPRSAAAVCSLFRIRAFEEAADAAGLRRVWHRGESGADLLTWVSPDGKVARQELTLLNDHFVWTPNGLRTARLEAGEGLEGEAASVCFDKPLSCQRAFAALAALRGYSGEDKYILHIQRILANAVGELNGADELVMTQDLHIPCASERTLALWGGAAVALAALVAASLALLG